MLGKELAQRLRISLPYLSQLESGRAVPSEDLARRIAREFSQDEDEVVFLARRTGNSLDAFMQTTPNSMQSYLSRLSPDSDTQRRLEKPMVRLIAQSHESLESLPPHLVVDGTRSGLAEFPPQTSKSLADVFDIVRPSVVAFASRRVAALPGARPVFPEILGTGLVVDGDGIVVTNDHVIEALQKLPPHPISKVPSGIAIVWGKAERTGEGHVLPIHFIEIKAYSRIESFSANGPYYGEDRPDIGFVQLKVRGLPALTLRTQPNTLRQGIDVAIAGFPRGTDPMLAYGKVSQLTPMLRRGIVSSLLPFPCPQPHGFTVDIMSQGGASGSPVFLVDSPEVVGLVHAGFQGTNLTYAIPSITIHEALSVCASGGGLDLSDIPTLQELTERAERSDELRWESFLERVPRKQ